MGENFQNMLVVLMVIVHPTLKHYVFLLKI